MVVAVVVVVVVVVVLLCHSVDYVSLALKIPCGKWLIKYVLCVLLLRVTQSVSMRTP